MDRIDAIEMVRQYVLSLLAEAAIGEYPYDYTSVLEDIEDILWKMM